jgi:hypothetical protein
LRNRVHPSDPKCAIKDAAVDVRGVVAVAMSVLENTGVMALGQNAVICFPARTVVRVAQARGSRWVGPS